MSFSIVARALLGVLIVVAVAGCQTIEEKRKIDYRSTRTLPPLEVPPDLANLPADKGGAPAAGATTYSEFATERKKQAAGTETVLPQFTNIRLERDRQTRWLVVRGAPADVWPRLPEFVLANGLLIARQNPASGTIETEWAENRAKVGTAGQRLLGKWLGTLYSTGTRDKFRIRLDRGVEPGTSEIYISHQGMEEVVTQAGTGGLPEATKWQPRASEPDLETELLRLLMVHLGVSEPQAKTAVAAVEQPVERAKLARSGDGAPFLSLEESLDRAWRRVGLTLDRVGFTVEDRDRSRWTYYIRYVDPDKRGKKASEDEYRIQLKAANSGTLVEVLTKDGAVVTASPGDRILGLLHEQLK